MTGHGGLRHMLVSLSKVTASTGARLVGVMGLYALMARALGPSGFGQFTYWYATGILLAALSDLGFGQRALTALAAGDDSDIRESFSSLLSARALTIGVALLIGVAWVVAGSDGGQEAVMAILLLAACLVASVFEFLAVAMRARGAYGLETRQAIWSALVGNLVAGAAGYATRNAVVAAAVMLVFRSFTLVLQFRVVHRQLGFTGPMLTTAHRRDIFNTLRTGASFIADSAAVQAVGYMDVWVARLLLSDPVFGVYMAGTRLMQALLTGIPIAASVFVPNLVRASADRLAMKRQRVMLYALCAAAGWLLCGLLALGAAWVGAGLFGPQFATLDDVLPIIGIAIACRYMAAAPGVDLTATGLQMRRVWANLATLGVFAGAGFLVSRQALSLRDFAWLLCIPSAAQIVAFGLARALPTRRSPAAAEARASR